MVTGRELDTQTVDLRPFKEALRRRLQAGGPVLSDLLQEPDSMPVDRAAILIPHYLRRLEREVESYAPSGPLIIRS